MPLATIISPSEPLKSSRLGVGRKRGNHEQCHGRHHVAGDRPTRVVCQGPERRDR
jgi:hypothetical protein